jgi:hypothetical protein
MGGMTNELTYVPNRNIEFYNPGFSKNILVPSEIIDQTGTPEYPKATIIPLSGDVYIFCANSFSVISKDTGLSLEITPWYSPDNGVTWKPRSATGRRSGNHIGGNCLLPIHASRGYLGEVAFFGGTNWDDVNQTARNDVARMVITAPAPKQWTYDTDRMPYGRVASDCTLQPNGKILITNGARLGFSGGFVGSPNLAAAAMGIIIDLSIFNM